MPNIPLTTLDLRSLPPKEDEIFEYKSSKTPMNRLAEKIGQAASAFCNSGGGCFVAGVGEDGKPDGGIDKTVGRQNLRDWADQAIALVSPSVSHEIRLFDDSAGLGHLNPQKVVFVVAFKESHSAPHMASDKRYYFRAGAHSVPAPHFIVESLWARRSFSRPYLVHALRDKPGSYGVVQVGILAVSPSPAIDVEFHLEPLTGMLKKLAKYFPIRLPAVDQNTPFFLDVGMLHQFETEIPNEVAVCLKYRDVAGNEYSYRSNRPLSEAINPLRIGADPVERIAKAIEKLSK